MKLTTIIKFSADWCQPCKNFTPIFEEVSKIEEFNDITFSEVDVDEDTNFFVEKFNIKNVPTLVFLDEENNVINKLIGGMSKTDLIKFITQFKEKAYNENN